MSEEKFAAPLDLATFDDLSDEAAKIEPLVPLTHDTLPVTGANQSLVAQPALPRLVDITNLSPEDLAAAKASAEKIDFTKTNTLLAHGDNVLAEIAKSSRQLLTGVRLGDAGEVGRIAAAVIDGIKILRVEDLQKESADGTSDARKGIVGRILGSLVDRHSAFKGFQENRKTFLTLMDSEQAKARAMKADLAVALELLDQQAAAIRKCLFGLKIEIAAGQIALDRGQEELEAMRQEAVKSNDPADAANVMEVRGALANFSGKIADMRENLVASALLIPIIGQNKKAAETRLMKLSNGMLVVIPRLMAVASQAAVQVDIRHAADEAEKLDEAARQITLLASKGAHDAATSAARSIGGDQRNLDVLAKVADEAILTMNDLANIEREVAAGDREREEKLTMIRDRLAAGMRGINQRALEPSPK